MKKQSWKFTAGLILAASLHAQSDSQKAQMAALQAELSNLEIAAIQSELSSAQFGLVAGTVRGAPYSADATTESLQVLVDGTRLRHQTTFFVWRDSEGRIARQNGQVVFVLDPVTNLSYKIDHMQKTVWQMPLAHALVRSITYEGLKSVTLADVLKRLKERNVGLVVESRYDPAKVQRAIDVLKELLLDHGRPNASVEVRLVSAHLSSVKIAFLVDENSTTAPPALQAPDDPSRKTENLGRRTIQGLVAEGTRVTTTIPIGAIGNDRPLLVVSERWYSPELQVNLRTERRDPRSGDAVFQLTNIRRREPAHSLFEVPPDYVVAAPVKRLP